MYKQRGRLQSAAFSLPLRVIRFTFDNLALTYNKFMQLVTPSVVAIAVKMAASVWMMNFQVSFFITLTLNSKLSTLN